MKYIAQLNTKHLNLLLLFILCFATIYIPQLITEPGLPEEWM
jgi:hypothetical protein